MARIGSGPSFAGWRDGRFDDPKLFIEYARHPKKAGEQEAPSISPGGERGRAAARTIALPPDG
jgi:hypothetical protein